MVTGKNSNMLAPAGFQYAVTLATGLKGAFSEVMSDTSGVTTINNTSSSPAERGQIALKHTHTAGGDAIANAIEILQRAGVLK